MRENPVRNRAAKASLLWTGVLFAFAANVLVVNVVQPLVGATTANLSFEALVTLVAPLVVGVATGLWVRRRAGMHAFLGGMLSIPVLAFTPFGGNWQFAILAGAFCAMGGILTELLLRARSAAR